MHCVRRPAACKYAKPQPTLPLQFWVMEASQGFGAVTRRIDYLGASELTISSKRGFVADPKRQQFQNSIAQRSRNASSRDELFKREIFLARLGEGLGLTERVE